MEAEGNRFIRGWRIPYDIDRFWDGGCGGGDLWNDAFGDEVVLLVSDKGSAYVCPEKSAAPWRLYSDGAGKVSMLFGKPGKSEEELRRVTGWPSLDTIRVCGISRDPSLTSALAEVGPPYPAPWGDPFTRSLGEKEISLGEWALGFSKGGASLHTTNCSYRVDAADIARTWHEWEVPSYPYEFDISANIYSEEILASDEDIDRAIEILKKGPEGNDPARKAAVGAAIAAFERARVHRQEIFSFEETCAQYLARGGEAR